jgi:myo-inositol-1(or 4)-monophosphatase
MNAQSQWSEIERVAFRLARLGGEQAMRAPPAHQLTVQFKSAGREGRGNFNPVSNIDREIEGVLRREIAASFPQHAVIGEELDEPARADAPFTWVLDPVDGTTNYLNGFPLFASSIGVLQEGVPVVGAIWCASTHALCPGVYHAHRGGSLCFEGEPLERRPAGAWRGLAGEPSWAVRHGAHFDRRVLASAAVECAFVAAGVLRLSHLSKPSIWDIAAGVVLGAAAGCSVFTKQADAWAPLTRFGGALREWRQPLIMGDPPAVERAVASIRGR